MKATRSIMGMHVTIEVADKKVSKVKIEQVFNYFEEIDSQFSTYKPISEISKINRGEIKKEEYSTLMKKVFKLAVETKKDTSGFFDIMHNGKIDPSGIVKGFAILNASEILKKNGLSNFYVDAGGDVATAGLNSDGKKWQIGIRNPFDKSQIVKVLSVSGEGVATSGNYERGEHIYNPKTGKSADEIASITVIGPNVYEADRFATAAFAMGQDGINFIERQKGLEGYMIDKKGIATYTSGFEKYL